MTGQLSGQGLWYDEHGAGDPLVLLHPGGAGVHSRALTPQLTAFAERFRVYTPEQRGHGRTPDAAGPLSYEQMAADTIGFIDDVVAELAVIPGTSHGLLVDD